MAQLKERADDQRRIDEGKGRMLTTGSRNDRYLSSPFPKSPKAVSRNGIKPFGRAQGAFKKDLADLGDE